MTESTRRFHGDGYERHKIFLYKEDFNRFLSGLEENINYIKTELMPDYDFDEFDRRQAEYEARKAEEERLEREGGGDDSSPDDDEKPASEDQIDW